jgi:2-alkenal reductase
MIAQFRKLSLVVPALLTALGAHPCNGQGTSVVAPRAVETRGELTAVERSTIALFRRVSPSVVQIVVKTEKAGDLFSSGSGEQSGTGFIWDSTGHVVTNNHVVKGATSISVRFATGGVLSASIVGVAPTYDLAVIRLNEARELPAPIAIGTSADLEVGQLAFAIGNPFGLDQSLTAGIISALKRRLPTTEGHEISNVIQTDAAINPGNSGGPLLDSAGRLIGVNTAIVAPINIGVGFAIPVDVVNRIVPELIRAGRVPTPGIGIVPADETTATRLGIVGIVIMQVSPGSPAEKAGLRGVDTRRNKVGDVIVAANGKPMHRLPDLTGELEQIGVGGKVRLTVTRNEQKLEIELEVADIGPR